MRKKIEKNFGDMEIIGNRRKIILSMFRPHKFEQPTKGKLISKANCQAMNSSKKQTNEFIFTTMRRIFVRFLEEIEDIKKTFRNYLTFTVFHYKTKSLCREPLIYHH